MHRKEAITPETASRLRLERDFARAVAWADSWVRRQRPHVVVLLDTDAAWNHHPATPAQLAALGRRGYPETSLRGITKGEATMLFSRPVPSFLKLPDRTQRS
ncbi:MAG: hypothetical protein HY815_30205 [Candidatus Riflebacteria bacterium]|nr:hypothetical protein [Candidatus Riflebacteria bacterium]